MTDTQTDFQVFWAAYPRRHAKKDALKAWRQLNPDTETVQAILDALEWQKQTDQWKRLIIPLPASYLRGARWEDEAPACHGRPQPTGEVLELARSIARGRSEQATEGRHAIEVREAELIGQGLSAPDAVMQASREWLRKQ
jgi:hypothetical protein